MIRSTRSCLVIILSGVLLTVLFTWPFTSKLDTFFYDRGDYPVSLSILSYNEHAFKTGQIFDKSTYFNGNEFYPQPDSLIFFDFRLIPSLIYSPIYWITDNLILSINSTLFLSFVFSFISSFYVINYFVKNKLSSLIGAIIYTFNPTTLSRFPEHFDLFHKYFLPLVFLFAYKYLKSPNIKDAFFFFLTFTLNAFSAISYQIFTLVTLPFFALPLIVSNLVSKNTKYFLALIKYGSVLIIFLPIFIYFDTAYLNLSKNEGLYRPIELTSFYSARLVDYISPNKQSLLYGSFVSSLDPFRLPKDENGEFNYLEHTLFLNIIPSLLLGLFLVHLLKKRYRAGYLTPFLWLLILSFLLTFGPFLQDLKENAQSIRLPFYYLYQIMPFLKANRTPVRFQFIFYLPLVIFIAHELNYLFGQIKKTYLIYTVFLILLIGLFLENFIPAGPIFSYNERSIIIPKFKMINSSGQLSFLFGKNTIHLPLRTLSRTGLDSLYLNWAAITHEKLVNGNIASYIPKEQVTLLTQLESGLSEDNLKRLSSLKVDYIVIHRDLLGDNQSGFKPLLAVDNRALVYWQNDLAILDLNKFQFNLNICDFNKDIEISLQRSLLPQYFQVVHSLILQNKSDCYLPSIYLDKYKNKLFSIPDLYGNISQRKVYFKLPVVIGPFEKVVLSEVDNNLRVE